MAEPYLHTMRARLRKTAPLLFLCATAATVAACQGETVAVEKARQNVRIVAAMPVEQVDSTNVTGEIDAATTTDLGFRVAGRVSAWHVDVGAHVKAGQVLAELDSTEQIADLDAAKAALTSARSNVQIAKTAFERQRLLMANGYTTRVTFDQARETLRMAEGTLISARAQLDISQEALGYTILLAPVDGTITARNVEIGQVMETTQTAYTLAENGQRNAIFDVNEYILDGLTIGSPLKVILISDPSVQAIGRVREISPVIDSKSGTIRVKIAVDDAPEAMSLGSPVSGAFTRGGAPSIPLPWTALTALDGKPAVWVLDPATMTVTRKPVEIGLHESHRFTVLSGVSAGEDVVTVGTKFLSPGQKVAILPTEESGS